MKNIYPSSLPADLIGGLREKNYFPAEKYFSILASGLYFYAYFFLLH